MREIREDEVPLEIRQSIMQEISEDEVPLEIRQAVMKEVGTTQGHAQEIPEDQVPLDVRQSILGQEPPKTSILDKVKNYLKREKPSIEEQKEIAAIREGFRNDPDNPEWKKRNEAIGGLVIPPKVRNVALKETAKEAVAQSPKTAVELGAILLSGAAWGWKKPVELAEKYGFKGRVEKKYAQVSGVLLRTAALMGGSSLLGSAVAPHIPGASKLAAAVGEKSLLAGKVVGRAAQALPSGGSFWATDKLGDETARYLNKEKKLTWKNIINSGGDILEAWGYGTSIALANIIPYGPVRIVVAGGTRYGVEKMRAGGKDLDAQAMIKVGVQMIMATRTGTALTGQDISAHNKALMKTASQFLPPKFYALPGPEQDEFLAEILKNMNTMPISKAVPAAIKTLEVDTFEATTTEGLKQIDATSQAIKTMTSEDLDPGLFNEKLVSEGQRELWKGQELTPEVKIPEAKLPETKHPFLGRDVIPKTKEFFGSLKKSTDWIKNTFNPLGKISVADQDILFKHIGKYRHDKDMFFARGNELRAKIEARGDAKNLEFANKFQAGDKGWKQMDTEELALAKHYQEFGKMHYGIVSEYKKINELDDFLTHVYNKIHGTDIGTPTTKEGLQRVRASFEGFKRTHMTIQDAIDKGLDPVLNMEDAARIKYTEAINFKMTQDLFSEYQPRGGIDYYHYSKVPDDFVEIDKPIMKVYFPNHAAINRGESLYAQKDLARILNNHLSSSKIATSIPGKTWQWTNRQMNLFNLALSGFHFSNTNMHAGGQMLGQGFKDVLHGRFISGAKKIAISPVAGPKAYLSGRKWINKMLAGNDPEAIDMAQAIYRGGLRVVPREYENRLTNFNHEIKNKNIPGAIIRAPGAGLEASLQPLMKHYIPKMKVGFFIESYRNALIHNASKIDAGLMTEGEVARAVGNHQDHLFGKMSKDNLFWSKNTEFALEATVRSTTYTLGTAKVYGGAAVDTAKASKAFLTGDFKNIEFTDNQATAIGILTMTAFLGGIYHKYHTGENPQELKDCYYPENGLTDEMGNPMRTKMMGYGTEIISWVKHPLRTAKHKVSPLANAVSEFISNEDYYDDMVRNPDASLQAQAYQTLKWGVGKFEPWSIKQARKDVALGTPGWQRMEATLGFTGAAREWRQSPTEKHIYDLYKKQSGIDIRLTPEKKEIQQRKLKATRELKQNNPEEFFKLVKEGEIKDQKGFIKKGMTPYAHRTFLRLNLENKGKALKKMDKAEKIRYLNLLED